MKRNISPRPPPPSLKNGHRTTATKDSISQNTLHERFSSSWNETYRPARGSTPISDRTIVMMVQGAIEKGTWGEDRSKNRSSGHGCAFR